MRINRYDEAALLPSDYDGICNSAIPNAESARYQEMYIGSRFTWRTPILIKHNHIKALLRGYYWLLGYHSKPSLSNKRLIYVAIIEPA